jgi:hypothetical protein
MADGDYFKITFPSEIVMPSNPLTCAGILKVSVISTCVVSGNTITASFTFSGGVIAAGDTFTF